jgi:hypothetical protein
MLIRQERVTDCIISQPPPIEKFLLNFPEITQTEQFDTTKSQIILILPGLGNTATIFDYTILIKKIARAGCFGPTPAKGRS